MTPAATAPVDANLAKRIDEHLRRTLVENYRETDRMFFWLLLAQWAFAIILALTLSPYAWEGKTRSIHLHVQIAFIFGAVINSLPLTLILLRPGERSTRYSVAVAQMLWSGDGTSSMSRATIRRALRATTICSAARFGDF